MASVFDRDKPRKTYNIPTSRAGQYNLSAVSPVMSAQEVQNTVAQNAGTPAVTPQAAAANASLTAPQDMPLSISGIGQTGGKEIVPGGSNYTNVYSAPMEKLMNQLLNPNGFKYDVNADGLYQQIKDNYLKQGRQAMMDTQGQSAALTGGYGNSYGAMAGQQAYQESLGNLQGMIPELQQLAWQQYQQGQDDKRNNLEALNKLENQEYARWMDEQQLRLDLYKQHPELMALAMNAGGPLGAGGPTSRQVDRMMSEMLDQKVLQAGVRDGTNNNKISLNQTIAWMNQMGMDAEQQAKYLGALESRGVEWTDADNKTYHTVVGDYNARNGYGVDTMTGAAPAVQGTAKTNTSNSAKNQSENFIQDSIDGLRKWWNGISGN